MTGQVHLTGQACSQYPDRPVRMQAGQLWEPDFQEGVGRTIKAARDIQIGEIVLEDSALLAVPDGSPVCLGCLGRVDGSFLVQAVGVLYVAMIVRGCQLITQSVNCLLLTR